jgi:hypothetical protein
VALAHAAPARACSCLQMPPRQVFEESDAVFEGRVLEIVPNDNGITARLEVVQSWKGVEIERVEVRTAGDSAACGIAFEVGTSWLVYADDENGVLSTGLCSRTARIEEAEEDLAALGAGVVPVEVDEDDEVEEPETNEPPARGGCASCSAARSDDSDAIAIVLSLFVVAIALRRQLL